MADTERGLELAPAAIRLRWHPWHPDNRTELGGRDMDSRNRDKVLEELRLLGVDPSDLGELSVRRPDRDGRLGAEPHARLTWLFDECRWVLRLLRRHLDRPGAVDPPVGERLDDVAVALETGLMGLPIWEIYVEMLALLNAMLSEDPEVMAELHEWVVDPALFQADCCSVFLSESLPDIDVVALTTSRGYAFMGRREMDFLFRFGGETVRQRPRFICQDAADVNVKKSLMGRPTGDDDKMVEIDRLRGLIAKQNREKGKE